MKTAHEIIDAAGGRQKVAKLLGVSPGRITNCTGEGVLPASWFDALERRIGQEPPRHLFSFKLALT